VNVPLAPLETKSPWLAALVAAWPRTDAIFAMVAREAMQDQPIPLRQPFIFYLGHLPAFGWNQVVRGVLGRPSRQPAFDELFERGIDPVGPDRYAASTTWPEIAEVVAYRDACRRALQETEASVLSRGESDVLAAGGRIHALVLEHERMHQETLLYMVQQLPAGRKHRPADWPSAPPAGRSVSDSRVRVPAGPTTLGARFAALPFGWDNEFPEQVVDVPAFTIAALPVCNREMAEFTEAGGYVDRRHWDDEGWAWKERRGLRGPSGWNGEPGDWRVRDLFGDRPLADTGEWPACVSWAEARAFAASQGARLPTEAEFHRAAFGTPEGDERAFPWGEAAPHEGLGNFGFRHGSPVPVGAYPAGASAWGVHELVGNGWEWTQTPFDGFTGFRPYIRTYLGYSKDFFDGKHYVLKGASWATDDGLVRRSFRNWFQPHYPYVFAKFRCVWPA
jgi:ergothioneine biosynthesis protein EgtB